MKCHICGEPLTDTEENVLKEVKMAGKGQVSIVYRFVCICMRCYGFIEKSDVRKAEEMVNLTNKISELTYTMTKIKDFSTNLLARYEGE
jgi:hypothetical protein